VSRLGLGGNSFGRRLDQDATTVVVRAALDCGITLFDTSDSYGESEVLLGTALRGRRDEAVVATKFGSDIGLAAVPRGGRRYVRAAVERSLTRLQTDRIDLYQQHWPDAETPIEETVGALAELVDEGKVRHIGLSNRSRAELVDATRAAERHGGPRFVSTQVGYSLVRRAARDGVLPACHELGVSAIAYRSLASGLLTGKHRFGAAPVPGTKLADRPDLVTERDVTVAASLQRYATDRGVGLLAVSLGSLAADPLVSVVVAGASDPEQLRANCAAFAWRPSPEEQVEIDRLTE
jgi:aryl-alcohol dehydrogenase-like predicted oxidoreductase